MSIDTSQCQCLQHAVSLIRNFNPKFQHLWSAYPYFCFVLYKIAANTHAALAIFSVFSFLFSVLAAIISYKYRIMGYNFTAQWLKGTSNEAADALSRHPHDQPRDGDDLGEQEVDTHHFQAAVYQALTLQQVRMSAASQHDMENLHLQELRHHAMQDQTYQTLKTIITEGFPNQKCSLPDSVKRFWSVKDHLSIDDDLIVYGRGYHRSQSTHAHKHTQKNKHPQSKLMVLHDLKRFHVSAIFTHRKLLCN